MERFARVRCADGGVLLDLESGEYYRLSPAGLADWEAGRLEVPERAPAMAAAARREADGWRLGDAWISADGRRVRAPSTAARLWAAPHLLALQGVTVLHAGAVIGDDGQVTAFVGATGAGKTTQARLAPGRLVSEDLLILDGLETLLEAEPAIRAWAAGRDDRLDAATMLHGARAPLARIRLLDATRRGPQSTIDSITGSAAIAALLQNAFAEIPDPNVWRRTLDTAARLADLDIAEATVRIL